MMAARSQNRELHSIWSALHEVMDPEIPVISVVDLGIVREVRVAGGDVEVVITPTYSGCPAGQQIEQDVRAALVAAGVSDAHLSISLSPPWTTDWITAQGREKLRQFGIAPPHAKAGKRALFEDIAAVECPHCRSHDTEQVSEFGSTACKALWRCVSCREPFDYFKCI